MTAFYSVKEIASTLGVSTDTVRRAIARGTLSTHRFGRAIRIASEDLERFLKTRRYPASAQPTLHRRTTNNRDYARLLRDRVRKEIS